MKTFISSSSICLPRHVSAGTTAMALGLITVRALENLEPSLAPWRAIPVAPQHSGWGRPHLEDVDVKLISLDHQLSGIHDHRVAASQSNCVHLACKAVGVHSPP
ncbi:uncharacterized protein AAG666_005865 isoform 1-T1 [Megaptera novaeangliae]